MSKPPIKLVERRAKSGAFDPLACAKALVTALERDPTLADELVIITIKRADDGLVPELRVASPKNELDIVPYVTGILTMMQHALLTTHGYAE